MMMIYMMMFIGVIGVSDDVPVLGAYLSSVPKVRAPLTFRESSLNCSRVITLHQE